MSDLVTLRTGQPTASLLASTGEGDFDLANADVVAFRPPAASPTNNVAPVRNGTGAPVSPGGAGGALLVPGGPSGLPEAPYGLSSVPVTPEVGQAIVTRALARGFGQDLLSVFKGQLPGSTVESGNVLEKILGDKLREQGIAADTINRLPDAKRQALFQAVAQAADTYLKTGGALYPKATRALDAALDDALIGAGLRKPREALTTMAPVMQNVGQTPAEVSRVLTNPPQIVNPKPQPGTSSNPFGNEPVNPMDPFGTGQSVTLGTLPGSAPSLIGQTFGSGGAPRDSAVSENPPFIEDPRPVPAAPVLPPVTLPPDPLAPLAKAHGTLLDRFMALKLDYDPQVAFEQGKRFTPEQAKALGQAVKAYESAYAADPMRANTAPALELAPAKAALKGFEAANARPTGTPGAALSPASEEALEAIRKQYGTGAAEEIANILYRQLGPLGNGPEAAREEIERRANETPGPNAYSSFLEKTAGAAPLGRTNGVPGSSDAGGTGGTNGNGGTATSGGPEESGAGAGDPIATENTATLAAIGSAETGALIGWAKAQGEAIRAQPAEIQRTLLLTLAARYDSLDPAEKADADAIGQIIIGQDSKALPGAAQATQGAQGQADLGSALEKLGILEKAAGPDALVRRAPLIFDPNNPNDLVVAALQPDAIPPSTLTGGADSIVGPIGELRRALPVLDDLLPLLDGLPQTWNAELRFLDSKLVIPPNDTLRGTTTMSIMVPPDLNRALRDRALLADGPRSQDYFDAVSAILRPGSGTTSDIVGNGEDRALATELFRAVEARPSEVVRRRAIEQETRDARYSQSWNVDAVFADGPKASQLVDFVNNIDEAGLDDPAYGVDPEVTARVDGGIETTARIIDLVHAATDGNPTVRVFSVSHPGNPDATLGAIATRVDDRTGDVEIMGMAVQTLGLGLEEALVSAAYAQSRSGVMRVPDTYIDTLHAFGETDEVETFLTESANTYRDIFESLGGRPSAEMPGYLIWRSAPASGTVNTGAEGASSPDRSSAAGTEISPEVRQLAAPEPSNVEPGTPNAERAKPPISVRVVYPDSDQANGLRTFLEMMGKNASSAAAEADPAVKERAELVEYLVEAILEDLEEAADKNYIRVLVANFASGGGTLGAASAWIDPKTGRVDLMDLLSGQGKMNIGGALLGAAFDLSPAGRLELSAYRDAADFYRRWGGQEQPLREPDALPDFVWTERPHLIE